MTKKDSPGTATVSGGSPLIRVQFCQIFEHIHRIVQLYRLDTFTQKVQSYKPDQTNYSQAFFEATEMKDDFNDVPNFDVLLTYAESLSTKAKKYINENQQYNIPGLQAFFINPVNIAFARIDDAIQKNTGQSSS